MHSRAKSPCKSCLPFGVLDHIAGLSRSALEMRQQNLHHPRRVLPYLSPKPCRNGVFPLPHSLSQYCKFSPQAPCQHRVWSPSPSFGYFFLMRIGYGEAESRAWASPAVLGERRGRRLPGAAGTSLQEKAGKNWQGVESSGKQIRKPAPIYRPAARNCPGGGATGVTLPAPSTSPKRAPLVPRRGWGKQGRPHTVLGLAAALYGGPPREECDG